MATPTSKYIRPRNPLLLSIAPRRHYREFFEDISMFSQKKMSSATVIKHIFENEFSCFPNCRKLGFTANQIGVNRPIEDRWSAYRIGGAMHFDEKFSNHTNPLFQFTKEFSGGNLFSVVDGHAGHTCAHAVNLIHADYIASSLLPRDLAKPVLTGWTLDQQGNENIHLSPLTQSYLIDDNAFMCSALDDESDDQVVIMNNTQATSSPTERTDNWRFWGPWGPLDSTVSQRRDANLRNLLKEQQLKDAADEFEKKCTMLANGNLYDPEGFLISEGSDFPVLDSKDANSTTLHEVSSVASAIRRGMERMDHDIISDAVPSSNGDLNKSLMRIVLSGCVATSIYLPKHQNVLYISQVGDCGAVLGRYNGKTAGASSPDNQTLKIIPKSFISSDWSGELLVKPHNAQNLSDIERFQSQHPIHEANLLLAEDRLLGELMPLRAFGDIRYKLPAKILKRIANLLRMPPNYPVCPRFYHSPPYLISTPQILCRKLDPSKDRFVILATDGLWDVLSPTEAVNVVGQHLVDYNGDPSLAGPKDTAASRLIRTALGGASMDNTRIAMHLSVPANVARFYRDDITVMVIYPYY